MWQGRERQAREYLETGVYAPADFARTKSEYDTHMTDLRAEAEELERKIAQAEQNEQNVDWTARTLTAAGDLDALDLDAKRRLLSALAVKVTVKTYTDERGRLKDWTAELESYGAVVTDLAVTGAMSCDAPPRRQKPVTDSIPVLAASVAWHRAVDALPAPAPGSLEGSGGAVAG
jgi:hypothetical protein